MTETICRLKILILKTKKSKSSDFFFFFKLHDVKRKEKIFQKTREKEKRKVE